MKQRVWILGCALALSVSAAVWVSGEPMEEAVNSAAVDLKQSAPKTKGTSVEKRSGELLLAQMQRIPERVSDANPFIAKSWYVAPPPLPPAPPPKPTAPPLPFSYMGKLDEGEEWTLYLAKGAQSFIVKKGEIFDSLYRLEGIENGNIVIEYLPLSTRQRLFIGSLS